MRIALIDGSKHSTVYPIALLKIGAWLKKQGHKCKLFTSRLPNNNVKYDEIWISTLFTFDIPYVKGMIREAKKRYKIIKVGGIAASLLPNEFKKENVEVTIGRIKAADESAPDYSLLKEKPEYSISYLSRGCVRKCKFCMVPVLEPKYEAMENWEKDLSPVANSIMFYDNNWLAKPFKDFQKDIEKLKKVIKEKNITKIDFNQGLDCRLVTEKKADLIQGLPIFPIRFAFDGMHEDGYWQKAVKIMVDRGFKRFRDYVLYNFKDTPEDFYYRLKLHAEYEFKYKAAFESFPMRYKPIMDIKKQKNYIGENWTAKEISGFNGIIANHVSTGVITCRNRPVFNNNALEEFEYYYGKDEKEFKKLINYDNIYTLCRRKRMKIIINAARLKANG